MGFFGPSKKELKTENKMLRDLVTPEHQTTLKQLYCEWSEIHYSTLTESGKQGYKTAYNYLRDIYGCKFRELKTADFQACVDTCASKFSRAQCEKVKQLCSQLCKYAMQNDIINKNYAQFIKLPKQEKKEREIFTEQDLERLWNNSDDEIASIVLVLCYTGFRIGELFDIKKANVNLAEKLIVGGNKTDANSRSFEPFCKHLYKSKKVLKATHLRRFKGFFSGTDTQNGTGLKT